MDEGDEDGESDDPNEPIEIIPEKNLNQGVLQQ